MMRNGYLRASWLGAIALSACGAPDHAGVGTSSGGEATVAAGGGDVALSGGASSGGASSGGASGGAAPNGGVANGGAAGATPGSGGSNSEAIPPEVSEAWSWEECGRIPSAGLYSGTASFLPDGTALVAAWNDGSIRLHALPLPPGSGVVLGSAGADPVAALGVSPDGTLIAEVRTDEIVLRSVADGQVLDEIDPGPDPCGDAVAVSRDNEAVLVSGDDEICLFGVEEGALLARWEVPGTGRYEPFVAFGGSEVVTARCSEDPYEVCFRDFAGQPAASVVLDADALPAGELLGPTVAPGGAIVLGGFVRSAGEIDVCAWNTEDGSLRYCQAVSPDVSWIPIFSPGGEKALLSGAVYDTGDGSLLFSAETGFGSSLSPDGELALDGSVLRQVRTGASLRVFATHLSTNPIYDLAISRDGSLLASNAFETLGFRVAPEFGESEAVWSVRAEGAYQVDLSADGRLGTVSGDVRLLFDAQNGRQLFAGYVTDDVLLASVDDLCFGSEFNFSPDGRLVAGKHYTSQLDVIDTETLMPVGAIETGGCGQGVAFSSDGSLLYTPEVVAQGPAFDTPVTIGGALSARERYIEVSPDGQHLIRTNCNLETGCRSTLDQDPDPIFETPEDQRRHARFSSEGHWIAFGGTLRHLPSGKEVILAGEASQALFAPDGDVIAGLPDATLVRYCRSQ